MELNSNEIREILASQERMEDLLHRICALVGERIDRDEPMQTGR